MAPSNNKIIRIFNHMLSNNTTIKVSVVKTSNKCSKIAVKDVGEVILKISKYSTEAGAIDFLKSNDKWIIKALTRVKQKAENVGEQNVLVGSNSSVKLLGKQYTVIVIESGKNEVFERGNYIAIYTKSPNNIVLTNKLYEQFRHLKSMQLYTELIKRYMYKCGLKDRPMPQINIKKVNGYWGQCRSQQNIINVNYKMIAFSLPCIEYLILHEVAHFLVQNHQKEFYAIVAKHMPDYNERRKELSGRKPSSNS